MQLEIFSRCRFCNEGVRIDHDASESPCGTCGGDGRTNIHYLNFGANIFHSYEILETLDATEYAELGAGAVAGINTLLSCGLVDLNEGKAGRVRLWNWFGEESTTVANLTAMLE